MPQVSQGKEIKLKLFIERTLEGALLSMLQFADTYILNKLQNQIFMLKVPQSYIELKL